MLCLHRPLLAASCAAMLLLGMPVMAASSDAPNTVIMRNFDFSPMVLTVPAGTAVTWTNRDDEPHPKMMAEIIVH
jgi:plastocyanin